MRKTSNSKAWLSINNDRKSYALSSLYLSRNLFLSSATTPYSSFRSVSSFWIRRRSSTTPREYHIKVRDDYISDIDIYKLLMQIALKSLISWLSLKISMVFSWCHHVKQQYMGYKKLAFANSLRHDDIF